MNSPYILFDRYRTEIRIPNSNLRPEKRVHFYIGMIQVLCGPVIPSITFVKKPYDLSSDIVLATPTDAFQKNREKIGNAFLKNFLCLLGEEECAQEEKPI